jgi:dTDP-4-amino-4,6-dideoxygalactose transaminase
MKFITLPLHAELTNEEIDYIIEKIKLFAEQK